MLSCAPKVVETSSASLASCNDDNSACCVCLEPVTPVDGPCQNHACCGRCKTVFHVDCLDKWVAEKLGSNVAATCPACRHVMVPLAKADGCGISAVDVKHHANEPHHYFLDEDYDAHSLDVGDHFIIDPEDIDSESVEIDYPDSDDPYESYYDKHHGSDYYGYNDYGD